MAAEPGAPLATRCASVLAGVEARISSSSPSLLDKAAAALDARAATMETAATASHSTTLDAAADFRSAGLGGGPGGAGGGGAGGGRGGCTSKSQTKLTDPVPSAEVGLAGAVKSLAGPSSPSSEAEGGVAAEAPTGSSGLAAFAKERAAKFLSSAAELRAGAAALRAKALAIRTAKRVLSSPQSFSVCLSFVDRGSALGVCKAWRLARNQKTFALCPMYYADLGLDALALIIASYPRLQSLSTTGINSPMTVWPPLPEGTLASNHSPSRAAKTSPTPVSWRRL